MGAVGDGTPSQGPEDDLGVGGIGDSPEVSITGDLFAKWAQALSVGLDRGVKLVDYRPVMECRNVICDMAVANVELVAGAMLDIIADLAITLPFGHPVHFGVYSQEWGFSGTPEFFRDDVRSAFPNGVAPEVRAILKGALKDVAEKVHGGMSAQDLVASLAKENWPALFDEMLRLADSVAQRWNARESDGSPILLPEESLAVALVLLCEAAVGWLILARRVSFPVIDTGSRSWQVESAEHWGEHVADWYAQGRGLGSIAPRLFWDAPRPRRFAAEFKVARRL